MGDGERSSRRDRVVASGAGGRSGRHGAAAGDSRPARRRKATHQGRRARDETERASSVRVGRRRAAAADVAHVGRDARAAASGDAVGSVAHVGRDAAAAGGGDAVGSVAHVGRDERAAGAGEAVGSVAHVGRDAAAAGGGDAVGSVAHVGRDERAAGGGDAVGSVAHVGRDAAAAGSGDAVGSVAHVGRDAAAVGSGDAVGSVAHVGRDGWVGWQQIDRALRACARRRAALDADEAGWLVAAERVAVHRELGCATLHEYLERVLGYGPKVARERLRVARALAALPALTAALAAGDLCHSAVREITRVATPTTEAAWLAAAHARSLREVEDLVRGRRPGDRPGDPPDDGLMPITIALAITPPTLALYRDAVRVLEHEIGEPLTDDQVLDLLCRAVLDRDAVGAGLGDGRVAGPDRATATGERAAGDTGRAGDAHGEPSGPIHDGTESTAESGPAPASGPGAAAAEPADLEAPDVGAGDAVGAGDPIGARHGGRPPYQIAITTCDMCRRSWQDASGRSFAVPPAVVAQAHCDADLIGRIDGEVPSRVTRTIPPAMRRQIVRRDRGRCVVPGCRAGRHLQVHHVVPRAAGGRHDPALMCLLCSGHHRALHAGRLVISGRAPDFVFRRCTGSADAEAPGSPAPS